MNFGVEMFGASRGHGSGGVVGPVLIPKRFVWAHGGRRVFLTGSFTRWLAFIPMSPMEGCPTIFQVICNLPPGYHQYKFNVDGEWRHDEHQPFVSGDCGIVNTMYLVGEPDILLPILRAEHLVDPTWRLTMMSLGMWKLIRGCHSLICRSQNTVYLFSCLHILLMSCFPSWARLLPWI